MSKILNQFGALLDTTTSDSNLAACRARRIEAEKTCREQILTILKANSCLIGQKAVKHAWLKRFRSRFPLVGRLVDAERVLKLVLRNSQWQKNVHP